MSITESTTVVSPESFKVAFRDHPAGAALVTATAGGVNVAMTVSSLFSISVDPPLLVYSVSDQSSTANILNEVDTVVVHLLASENLWLAKLGATSGIDRFGNPDKWSVLPTGEPYFPGPRSVIRARVSQRVRAGTSTLSVAEALEIVGETDGASQRVKPLVYHNRTWHSLADSSVAREMTWLTTLGLTDDVET